MKLIGDGVQNCQGNCKKGEIRAGVVSSELEGTINENREDGIDEEVGGFFDDEVLPVNLAGSKSGLRGERENEDSPGDSWQPIFNPAAGGHIL